MIKKLLNRIFNRKNVVFENLTEEMSSVMLENKTNQSENKLSVEEKINSDIEEIETLIADMKRAKALNDIVRDEITKKAEDFEKSLKKKKK